MQPTIQTFASNDPEIEGYIAARWPFEKLPARVVVKLGSNVLSRADGSLNRERILAVAGQVAKIKAQQGTEFIIVSSGAVAAGMSELGFTARPTMLPELQSLAAVGQSALMATWREAFAHSNQPIGQILLSRADLNDRQRFLNAQHTLEKLVQLGVVPIVNENDSVATEELSFGDNDMLSAFVATKVGAQLLVILSDIEGLFTGNPRNDPDARFIPVVDEVTEEIEALAQGRGSAVGRGGMATKIGAAKHAKTFGVATIMANGAAEGILERIAVGKFRGTLFRSVKDQKGGKAHLRWISAVKPVGKLTVDAGAVAAIQTKGSSLLPVGIQAVAGEFVAGDVISICTAKGTEVARGISNYSHADLELIRGKRCVEFSAILSGRPVYEECIHRNYMYVLPRNAI
ncbi:MAG: glutamate 5-kinase [Sumerlaeia bacterium]